MNESGKAVHALLTYYGLDIEDLLVIYDDLDMEVGKIRLRKKDQLEVITELNRLSIILELRLFIELRLELEDLRQGMSVVHHVLGKFDKDDYITILQTIDSSRRRLTITLVEPKILKEACRNTTGK